MMLAACLLWSVVMTQVTLGCVPSRERKQQTQEELLQEFMDKHKRRLEMEKKKCITPQDPELGANPTFCDAMWDDVMCWQSAAPGSLVTQPCPDYIIRSVSEGAARRRCLENGSWSFEQENECIPQRNATHVVRLGPIEDSVLRARWFPVLKTLSQVGYSVSAVTLTVAFCLLSTMRKLRCPRNMLHLHLFVSFLMRAVAMLLNDILFVKGVGLAKDVELDEGGLVYFKSERNNWECKVLTTICNYCIVANYTWIFMEGLYLHNLIFLALFSDTSAITLYVILGWGLPVLFVVPWVVARVKLEDSMCWTTHDDPHIFLLIRLPIAISVLLSFALFINIVRVLLVKMTSNVCLERRLRYRRWAKSTLVLVPFFGAHYVLFLWMSPSQQVDPSLEILCLFCDQLFASLQGFFVSLLYCLLNSEVRAELVRKWRSYKHNRGQPKRGSAQSLPVVPNSVLSASRVYTGGCPGAESLSSASGVVIQEAIGQDFLSASKFLQDQRNDTNQVLPLFQEIELKGYFCNDDVYLNTKQHNQTPNVFLSQEQTLDEENQIGMDVYSNFNTADSTGK